jgi:hypothetical protein
LRLIPVLTRASGCGATFYSCRLKAESPDAAYALDRRLGESVGAAPIYRAGFFRALGGYGPLHRSDPAGTLTVPGKAVL